MGGFGEPQNLDNSTPSPLATGSTADQIQDSHSDVQVPPRHASTVLTDVL